MKRWLTVMIVPTGVGASVGGYGGDATQALHQLAAISPACLTHPNVLNAAMFFNKPANTLYTEGYSLDGFLRGKLALRPVSHQPVGLLWDAGIEPRMRLLHENTVQAVQCIYGIDVVASATTLKPLSLSCKISPSGLAAGGLKNPDVLFSAADQLIEQGAKAIAILSAFPNPEDADYMAGAGVDPISGLEAVLSHLVSARFQVPCANTPVFDWEAALPEQNRLVDPRVASEAIAMTFLPCVLQGLSQSPDLIPATLARPGEDWLVDDVRALVVPWQTLGGLGTLATLAQGRCPILMVRQNTTICDTPQLAAMAGDKVIAVQSYAEAADWLAHGYNT